MRIAHVISSLDSSQGGPPIVAASLASALFNNNYDVVLFGGIPSKRSISDSVLEHIPEKLQSEIITFQLHGSALRRYLSMELMKFLRINGPFDVVHFHGVWCIELLHVIKYAKENSIPYYISPHGMLDSWSLSQKSVKKKLALFLYIKKILCKAECIFVLSEYEKKCISQLGVDAKMEIVGNGVFDINDDDEIHNSNSQNLVSRTKTPYFLFLSRLHYVKGLDILANAWVKAINELNDVNLVIVGPIEDDSIYQFNNIIAKAGIEDTVTVMPAIYGKEKLEMMRNALAFVLPSRHEGFSMAIVEALSQGVPVVISKECNFDEVASSDAGIVCQLSADPISDGIIKIVREPELRKTMSRNAISLVSNNYTWDIISKKVSKVYLDSENYNN